MRNLWWSAAIVTLGLTSTPASAVSCPALAHLIGAGANGSTQLRGQYEENFRQYVATERLNQTADCHIIAFDGSGGYQCGWSFGPNDREVARETARRIIKDVKRCYPLVKAEPEIVDSGPRQSRAQALRIRRGVSITLNSYYYQSKSDPALSGWRDLFTLTVDDPGTNEIR